jgi:energy-coupling factor transporter ATP-binding protein EcfA2
VCQEGTQTGAISYIHKWIEEGETSVLWVCSHAGSGKSTLARTIARDITKSGQMAAGYFFRRGDVGRNHIRHVIPTIAAQLVSTIPQYESRLRKSIDACKNTDFENMLLFEQSRVLLKSPLSQVGHIPSTKVIIIDALDECVEIDQLERVVDLLVSLMSLGSIRFRLLVTSRDEDPVRAAIVRHGHKRLSLATAYHDDNISDIESILRVGFQRIRKERKIEHTWPTEEQFREVVRRSTNPSPLFIYATTLLRFLGDGTRLGVPKKRLRVWIENSVGVTFTTQLDEMYTTVFKNLDPDLGPECSENLTRDEKDTLRMILGAIALAVEPLSVNSLVDILGLDPDTLELVKACRAVLYVPENDDDPVQMLHKSFSDFLLRPNQQGLCWFNVDERKQNELLAQGCMRHLKDRLRVNICRLQDPAILRVKIQPSIIRRCIPYSLQYASSYWVQHTRNSGDADVLAGTIEPFLYKKFLEWTECMAILGRLDRVLSAIQDLRVNTQV